MARSREETLRAKREGMARRRAADPDAVRAYQREWHKRNREQNCQKMRDYYARRFFWGKAMKLRGKDRADYRQIAALWKAQKGFCALTGRRLDRSAELDHIIAKARGGSDGVTNLRWVCRAVNFARRDLPDDEFFALCRDVMRWIGSRIELVERLSKETEAA